MKTAQCSGLLASTTDIMLPSSHWAPAPVPLALGLLPIKTESAIANESVHTKEQTELGWALALPLNRAEATIAGMCICAHISVQFSSVTQSCLTLCAPGNAACQASLSITNSQCLLKLMSIESVMPSSHLILCQPLLLLPPSPPSIRVFSNESTLHMRWPKYWSFRFSISPSNEHPGLTSFRMDWLDLLAVQGTLKSLLQHHSSCLFSSVQSLSRVQLFATP